MFRCFTLLLVAACGMTSVKLEPVKVEPIHMTIDVNLHDSNEHPAKPATNR
jgi:hypothetical protein